MAAQIYLHRSGAQGMPATSSFGRLRGKVTTAWHRMLDDVSSPYRPECHYMRGPGPKWYAKYQRQSEPSRHDPVEDIPSVPILHFHNP